MLSTRAGYVGRYLSASVPLTKMSVLTGSMSSSVLDAHAFQTFHYAAEESVQDRSQRPHNEMAAVKPISPVRKN